MTFMCFTTDMSAEEFYSHIIYPNLLEKAYLFHPGKHKLFQHVSKIFASFCINAYNIKPLKE